MTYTARKKALKKSYRIFHLVNVFVQPRHSVLKEVRNVLYVPVFCTEAIMATRENVYRHSVLFGVLHFLSILFEFFSSVGAVTCLTIV